MKPIELILAASLAVAAVAPALSQTPPPGATVGPRKAKADAKVSRTAHEAVMLNPQPLPPKESPLVVKRSAAELNPQPLPPVEIGLVNGQKARLSGKRLMLITPGGEIKAAAGRYKTTDGKVLSVNARGEIAN